MDIRAYGNNKSGHTSIIIEELCFILLPFIVLGIVEASKSEWINIFDEPEWSILAAVLYGQTIIRLAKMTVEMTVSYKIDRRFFTALIACIIALLLVPSLTILTLVVERKPSAPNLFLQWSQVILFGIATIVFIIALLAEKNVKEKHANKG